MPRPKSRVIKTIAHWEVVLKPAGESKFYTPDVGEMFKLGDGYYERLPDPRPDSIVNGYRFAEDCDMGLYRSLGEELLHVFFGPFRAVPMEAHVIKVKESKKCEPNKRSSSAPAPSAVSEPQNIQDWNVVVSDVNPAARLDESTLNRLLGEYTASRIFRVTQVTPTRTEEPQTDANQ